MKKVVALCMLSAVAGAVLTELGRTAVPTKTAWAQQPRADATPVVQPVAAPPVVGQQVNANARSTTRLPPPSAPIEQLTPDEQVNIAVYENVNRSVVNINTKTVRNDAFLFFDLSSEGGGSGSVLDTRGHILTNYHVVEGVQKIQVALFDGKDYEGRLVGKDESNDVAVIKIDAPPESLLPVTFGDSTHLRVGQRVFAIGNPFGLERTLSTGIISSLNRTLPARNRREIKSIIQIDASINPGSSGGPLLDSHGRLIGMNTAIASASGQSAGVGFAIPVANIARIVPQLIERGKVIRPDAGITRVQQTDHGLIIATMTPGGPAEQAGLRGFKVVRQKRKQGPFSYESQSIDRSAADTIVAVDGQKVATVGDFLSIVESHKPGQDITVTVLRGGQEVNVPLRLAAGDS